MNKKQIQNLLNASLDKKTPKLTKKILSAPINTSDNSLPEQKAEKSFSLKKKSIITWVSAVACVLVVVIVASVLGVYFKNVENQPVVTLQTTCYEVDINPSVLITADKDGTVTHIAAQNDDADVVLSSESFADYKQMTAEECMETFILESARLGYIDCTAKDNRIDITVISGEKSSKSSKLAKQTQQNLQSYLQEIDIFGVVSATVSAVKDFVVGKGWQYTQSNLDAYTENLEGEFIFHRANSLGDGVLENISSKIDEFVNKTSDIYNLLVELDELNTLIEEESGKSYWDWKLAIFTDKLSEKTKELIAKADAVREQLANYDISVLSVISLDAYLIKYSIIEDIKTLVAEIKDNIAQSKLINTLLEYIAILDENLYDLLNNEVMTFYNEVVESLNNLYEERVSKFLNIFDSRPEISQQEYEEYLSSQSKS